MSVFAESASLHRNSGAFSIMKTFIARLESIVRKRKSEVRTSKAASGIKEKLSEKDQLIDDLVREMREFSERRKEADSRRNAREAELLCSLH